VKIVYPLPVYGPVMVKSNPPPGVPQGPAVNLSGTWCSFGRAQAVANMLMPEWGTDLVPLLSEESGGNYSEMLDLSAPNHTQLVADNFGCWYIPGVGNAQQVIMAVEQNGVDAPGYFVPACAISSATTSTAPVFLSQWNPASGCPMVQSPQTKIAGLQAIVTKTLAQIALLEKAG
jgi:hypothetical protein